MSKVYEQKPNTRDIFNAINSTKGTDISSSTLYDVVTAVKNIVITGGGAVIDFTPVVSAINTGTQATKDLSGNLNANFDDLMTDISTNSYQITTSLKTNITTLITDISINTAQVITNLNSNFDDLMTDISTNAYQVTSALGSNINTLITDISINTAQVITNLNANFDDLMTDISTNSYQVTSALGSNINTLITDISINTAHVTSALGSNINTLITDISINTLQVTSALGSNINTLITDISVNSNQIINAVLQPISFKSENVDAFGRLRVSEVVTLLDLTHTIGKNNLIECEKTNNAGTTHHPNASCVDLDLSGTTSSSYIIRQSRKYTIYQPGKSLLVLATGVLCVNPGDQIISRIGYFDSSNGFFFEYNNGTVNIVKRSYVTGSVVETRISQINWNQNTLLGSYFNPNLANIYFFDFEWLGVGMVRCGIVHEGHYVNLHDFFHDNVVSNVYMTSANLPIRYEIIGNGTAGTLRQICASVQSEGGYSPIGYVFTASRETTARSVNNTEIPVISLRLKTSRIRSDVQPRQFSLFSQSATNMIYRLRLFRSPAVDPLTNSSWNDVNSDSAIQYDIASTVFNSNGSYILSQGYFVGGKSDITLRQIDSLFRDFVSIAADIDGNTDYLVLTCQNLAASSDNIYATIDWSEFY